MAKKITGYVKLQVPAGAANPSPPIGPALGQRGLNIMEFCKAFNAKTAQMEKGMPIPVIITAYQDRSFTFEMKQPPVSYWLKKAAGLTAGSKTPGRGGNVGKVTHRPDQGDRREEDGRSQLRYRRIGLVHDQGLRPFDGPGSRGLRGLKMAHIGKRVVKGREGIDRTKLYPLSEAVAIVKERATAKFDETVEICDESRCRSASRRPDGPRRLQPAERLGPHPARRRVRPRRQGRGGQEGRCRHRRRRGAGRDRQSEGHDRLRSLHRDPGHDAARRSSR